jgi:hypothetical protein
MTGPRSAPVTGHLAPPGRREGRDAVKTTMGRQVRVGNRVSRPGLVRAPAAMAASRP